MSGEIVEVRMLYCAEQHLIIVLLLDRCYTAFCLLITGRCIKSPYDSASVQLSRVDAVKHGAFERQCLLLMQAHWGVSAEESSYSGRCP